MQSTQQTKDLTEALLTANVLIKKYHFQWTELRWSTPYNKSVGNDINDSETLVYNSNVECNKND